MTLTKCKRHWSGAPFWSKLNSNLPLGSMDRTRSVTILRSASTAPSTKKNQNDNVLGFLQSEVNSEAGKTDIRVFLKPRTPKCSTWDSLNYILGVQTTFPRQSPFDDWCVRSHKACLQACYKLLGSVFFSGNANHCKSTRKTEQPIVKWWHKLKIWSTWTQHRRTVWLTSESCFMILKRFSTQRHHHLPMGLKEGCYWTLLLKTWHSNSFWRSSFDNLTTDSSYTCANMDNKTFA